MTTRALVIGLGNEYQSDDAAGRAVARKLKASTLVEFCVKEESGEGGALIEAWKHADFVVLVDAVDSGAQSGSRTGAEQFVSEKRYGEPNLFVQRPRGFGRGGESVRV